MTTEAPADLRLNLGCGTDIRAGDVLEHVDHVVVLREMHRLLRPGGAARITVPHFTSPDVHGDPTHRRGYAVGTFAFARIDDPPPLPAPAGALDERAGRAMGECIAAPPVAL